MNEENSNLDILEMTTREHMERAVDHAGQALEKVATEEEGEPMAFGYILMPAKYYDLSYFNYWRETNVELPGVNGCYLGILEVNNPETNEEELTVDILRFEKSFELNVDTGEEVEKTKWLYMKNDILATPLFWTPIPQFGDDE